MMNVPSRVVLASCLVLLASAPAAAEIEFRGWGPRVGVADDPDQVVGGVHFDLGTFVENVRFQPVALAGLGDDFTVIAGVAAAHYVFEVDASVRPYAGAGIAVSWYDRDDDLGPPFDDDDDSDFEVGPRAIGGVEWALSGGSRFLLELSVAVGDDVHDVRAVAGWTF